MRLGVVGYGVVGRALARFFARAQMHTLCIYDKYLDGYDTAANRAAVNNCDLVFVAVPTPAADCGAADISAVVECAKWIEAPICIRSTIPPGTTAKLIADTHKQICFSPEYIGEASNHPWGEEDGCGYLIVGGDAQLAETVFQAYGSVVCPDFRYVVTDPTTAELCKYMENCFLAAKVAFVNQFYDIARELGVDYEELRSLWLMDSRIGESHTTVTKERGFGGRCLPKDVRALISCMQAHGGAPLLEAVLSFNALVRRERPLTAESAVQG